MALEGVSTQPFATVDFLGTEVARLTTQEFISYFVEQVDARTTDGSVRPLFVTYLNAACSNLAAGDVLYRHALASADLVYADGQAIVWATRWLGSPLPERVNAADFFPEFCRTIAARGYSLYFLGSPPGVAEGAARAFVQCVPTLKVVGTHHGFFSPEEEAAIVLRIREAQPDILIVGMGVPRQELWVLRHRDALGVKAVWCVGAMFEYFAGYRARAPRWMRRAGLEWLFRLMLEPRRLWKRYIVGNVVFLARVGRALVQQCFSPR